MIWILALNTIFTTLVTVILMRLYAIGVDLGIQTIPYSLSVSRIRRPLFRRYFYSLQSVFNDTPIYRTISKADYDILNARQPKTVPVHMCYYAEKWKSPDYETYEISLDPVNWEKLHRKRAYLFGISWWIVIELLAICICFGL